MLQLKQLSKPIPGSDFSVHHTVRESSNEVSISTNMQTHASSVEVVDWELGPIYASGDIPHPSYVKVAPEGELQPALDIMTELVKLRVAANTQRKTLTDANRMPPETAVSRMIAEQTRRYMAEDARSSVSELKPSKTVSIPPAEKESARPAIPGLSRMPNLCPSETEFPEFVNRRYPNKVGVILGVGKGAFATRLLEAWKSTFMYLVDPYIHIWKGYEEKGNVDDKTHQLIFENLRSELLRFEGKFTFIRDFSSECTLLSFLYCTACCSRENVPRSAEPTGTRVRVDRR